MGWMVDLKTGYHVQVRFVADIYPPHLMYYCHFRSGVSQYWNHLLKNRFPLPTPLLLVLLMLALICMVNV